MILTSPSFQLFFTIYAYDQLRDWLNKIDHMKFLFGEPRFVRALDPEKSEKKSFVIESDGLRLANTLHQKLVAKECSDWIREKVSIKSIKQTNFLLSLYRYNLSVLHLITDCLS